MSPPDAVGKTILRQWIFKAEADLDAAGALLSDERASLYPCCFHCQQAVEKFIKGYLSWKHVEFPKTHSIRRLIRLVQPVDPALAAELKPTGALTRYGVVVRYPGEAPEPTHEQADRALALARGAREAIFKALPEARDPSAP